MARPRPVAILILCLAAVPCLWALWTRGVFYHDEALFLGNGLYYSGMIRAAAAMILEGGLSPDLLMRESERLWEAGGTPSLHARPMHEWGLSLAFLLLGAGDTLGLLLSAVAAVGSVAALAASLDRRNHPWAAPVAAALMALSAWHVLYARSGLSQSMSLLALCLLLAVMLRTRWETRRRTRGELAGIALLTGTAFTTHYNLFWVPLLVGGWLAWWEWRSRAGTRGWLLRMAAAAACMAAPALAFELPYHLAKPWIGARLAAGGLDAEAYLAQFLSYFQQLAFQIFFFEDPASMPPLSPLYLPDHLFRTESLPFVLLLLAGGLHLFRRAWKGDAASLFLALWISIPALFWTRFGYPAPRSFLPVLPALCLGAGLLIESLGSRGSLPAPSGRRSMVLGLAFAALFAALIAAQVHRLVPISKAVSPWREVAEGIREYSRSHGGARVADGELSGYNRPILRLYLKELVDREADRGRLLIVDPTTLYERRGGDGRLDSALGRRTPVISVACDLTAGMSMADAFDPQFIRRYGAGEFPRRIDVYDMRQVP